MGQENGQTVNNIKRKIERRQYKKVPKWIDRLLNKGQTIERIDRKISGIQKRRQADERNGKMDEHVQNDLRKAKVTEFLTRIFYALQAERQC